jgi:Zn ribbon nucleic-acid-binding protein
MLGNVATLEVHACPRCITGAVQTVADERGEPYRSCVTCAWHEYTPMNQERQRAARMPFDTVSRRYRVEQARLKRQSVV